MSHTLFQMQRLYLQRRIVLEGRLIINSKQIRLLKEIFVTYYKVLSSHLPGETEENHYKLKDRLEPGHESHLSGTQV